MTRQPTPDDASGMADVLVVTRLGRLGCSLCQLMNLTDELRQRGSGLWVLNQGIPTATQAGRMFFQSIGAFPGSRPV